MCTTCLRRARSEVTSYELALILQIPASHCFIERTCSQSLFALQSPATFAGLLHNSTVSWPARRIPKKVRQCTQATRWTPGRCEASRTRSLRNKQAHKKAMANRLNQIIPRSRILAATINHTPTVSPCLANVQVKIRQRLRAW